MEHHYHDQSNCQIVKCFMIHLFIIFIIKSNWMQNINLQSDCGSISQLLELFKHLKTLPNKDMSSLSFSLDSHQESRHRNPLGSITSINTNTNNSCFQHKNSKGFCTAQSQVTVFDKLYNEKKQLDQRKCRMEYQSRQSKEAKETKQCTFNPKIGRKSPMHIRTSYDSVEKNQEFYQKNIEWLERKERSIKKMQCETNQKKTVELTFTPRINKERNKTARDINDPKGKITESRGVQGFLGRQRKAQAQQNYKKQRKKNPYSHVWNIKKGHFSYIK